MKSAFLTLTFLVLISVCIAQIPNQSFESWTNMGAYDNPDSWGTLNEFTSSSGIFTATKASPGNPGSYYLKLTSQTINSTVVGGIAVSGIIDTSTFLPVSGFAFDQRPQNFTGKWQHMIYGSSQGSLSVLLSKWNSTLSVRDTIATALSTLSGMAMSWANFSITFNYVSGQYPDSCIIVLKSSGPSPAQNDYLWVDNLAFTGSVVGISETSDSDKEITVFPNSAAGVIAISYPGIIQKGDVLIIADMAGDVVYGESINEKLIIINTSDFSNGIYIISFINKFGVKYSSEKFSIQH